MPMHRKMNDRDYVRARIDQIVVERFKTLCMNDSKWVRLLDALTVTEGLVVDCRVKLVWEGELRRMCIDGMTRDVDYYLHAMEAMISGAPRGWYDYKEIEWIEFPAHAQDLAAIRTAIESVGQFALDSTDVRLRLYAYRE